MFLVPPWFQDSDSDPWIDAYFIRTEIEAIQWGDGYGDSYGDGEGDGSSMFDGYYGRNNGTGLGGGYRTYFSAHDAW